MGAATPEHDPRAARSPDGSRTWSYWIRQPVLSPDGKTLAMVSDRPDPIEQRRRPPVLRPRHRRSRAFPGRCAGDRRRSATRTRPGVRRPGPPLRPERPRRLARVRRASTAGRSPPRRRPRSPVPGYLEPSYSPDGDYIAATKTSSFGTDIVILDASNGRELLRVTNDGASWAPAWSPAGDAIAFLHIDGPDRRPQARPARRGGPGLDGQGHHRPDRGLRPRRRVAPGLVRPGERAAGADADAGRRAARRAPRRERAPRPTP